MKIPDDVRLDPYQLKVAEILQQLSVDLLNSRRSSLSQKLSQLVTGKNTTAPKGIYIHGAVGRGKTMLMDAFYSDLAIEKKERWHFHAFMQGVHDRLNQIRTESNKSTEDQPIIVLAKEIADRTKLLCFDEFHVSDIADAMILGRLFSKLFEYGLVVVATSNQHPDELYKNGLHRDRFTPFITLLKAAAPEVELNGDVDYRREFLRNHRRYFSPNTHEARHELRSLFNELAGDNDIKSVVLESKGRSIEIPEAANGQALVNFAQLCEQPLGAADYIVLADNFHTLFLEDVPCMNEDQHNEAKRFMTLIDILYDRQINIVISAEGKPDELYKKGKNSEAFSRTVSRLIEMTGG